MVTPHSLRNAQFTNELSPSQKAEKFAELGPLARRYGRLPKGAALPETRVLACPRVKVADLPEGFIPPKYYEKNLEQNQLIAHCCRHPENHDIEAFKSHPDEKAPDIYIFHCQCGKKHTRWLIGMTDDVPRPIWDAS